MKVTVYLIYKKDEPRIYTRTLEPTDDMMTTWRKEGFKIYRVYLYLPTDDCAQIDDIIPSTCVESVDAKV